MDSIKIEIAKTTFQQLQKLATPLVDDIDSVIGRLIAHWEQSPPESNDGISGDPDQGLWVSPRGEVLPFAPLRARYLGQQYSAKVSRNGIEYNGELFKTLSAAAIAVKKSAGKQGDAAATNGWDFWEIYCDNKWVLASTLRQSGRNHAEVFLKQQLAR